ncbi:MAG: HEPN domain-containing protein [Melioribacteraceae bacterium]|nr:HEPN domain-containing protein [Melioribacteraceae bacterium]
MDNRITKISSFIESINIESHLKRHPIENPLFLFTKTNRLKVDIALHKKITIVVDEVFHILNNNSNIVDKQMIRDVINQSLKLYLKKQPYDKLLLSELLNQKDFQIFIPIEGLIINRKIVFGNLEFFRLTERYIRNTFDSETAFHFDDFLHSSSKNKDTINIYCKVNVKALNSKTAKLKATSQINDVLNYLNFFSSLSNEIVDSGKVYIPSYSSLNRNIITLSIGNNTKISHFSSNRIKSFNINDLKYDIGLQKVFNKAKKLYKSTNTNKNKKQLLFSIQNCGSAMWDDDNNKSILLYFSSIESLLFPQGSQELSFKSALFIATLLNKKKGIDRFKMYQLLKNLYNKRSLLIHGKETVITNDELEELRIITVRLILFYFSNGHKLKNIEEYILKELL